MGDALGCALKKWYDISSLSSTVASTAAEPAQYAKRLEL